MVKWIIQRNLIKKELLEEFKAAFAELNVDFEEVVAVPFSDQLPEFTPGTINLFYGSTTLMLNAYESERFRSGVFYDPATFTVANYIKNWGDKMLNAGGQVLKLQTFVENLVHTKDRWFLRPNEDTKTFAGTTMSPAEIKDWYSKIQLIESPELHPDSLIFVSEVKEIRKEWRNILVNNNVVDSSRYLLDDHLNISRTDIPKEMIQFAENCALEYAPHPIFVMDIAQVGEEFKIIECNCFNGTGFYDHDILKIVKAITNATSK